MADLRDADAQNRRRSRFAHRAEPRRSIELVWFLRHSLAAHTETLIRMVDRPVSRLWDRRASGPRRIRAPHPRTTAEVQLLWELRQALCRRTVHVPSSLSFKSRAKMLDPGDSSIRAPRREYPVKQMLRKLTAEIEFGLERVSEAAERGDLNIDGTMIKVGD